MKEVIELEKQYVSKDDKRIICIPNEVVMSYDNESTIVVFTVKDSNRKWYLKLCDFLDKYKLK